MNSTNKPKECFINKKAFFSLLALKILSFFKLTDRTKNSVQNSNYSNFNICQEKINKVDYNLRPWLKKRKSLPCANSTTVNASKSAPASHAPAHAQSAKRKAASNTIKKTNESITFTRSNTYDILSTNTSTQISPAKPISKKWSLTILFWPKSNLKNCTTQFMKRSIGSSSIL